MMVGIVTLIFGFTIGYLGQRARLCYIAGYRDLFLTRDTYIIKGMLGTFIGAIGGFMLFSFLGGNVPGFPMLLDTPGMGLRSAWLFAIVGGLGLGFFGCLSGGCPYRLHVMAAEGKKTFWAYALGFYLGLIYFNVVTTRFLEWVVQVVR
jgi:uncharacterized membrane protein YedE/YeeE